MLATARRRARSDAPYPKDILVIVLDKKESQKYNSLIAIELNRDMRCKTCSAMKTILVFVFGFMVLHGFAFAGIGTDIAETNRVILASGRWTPSVNEAQTALTAIQSFLETRNSTNDWDRGEIEKILKHAKEYRVQFVGIMRDGKKRIWCNFFPKQDRFDYWKRQEVRVMDGGFWFWRIEYDSSTGKCLNFAINGIA